jgi:hypothetical protein
VSKEEVKEIKPQVDLEGATVDHIERIKDVNQPVGELRGAKPKGKKKLANRLGVKAEPMQTVLHGQTKGSGKKNATEGQGSMVGVDSSASTVNTRRRLDASDTDAPGSRAAEHNGSIQNSGNSAMTVSSSLQRAASIPGSGKPHQPLNNKKANFPAKVREDRTSISEPRPFNGLSQTQLSSSKPPRTDRQEGDAILSGSRDILSSNMGKRGATTTASFDSEDAEAELERADKIRKQISADAPGEGESPPRKPSEASPSQTSRLSVNAKEAPRRGDLEKGSSDDSSDSGSDPVANRVSNSTSNRASDPDSSSDSTSDSDSESDSTDDNNTSRSSSSLRDSLRPKRHIPGLRPLGRGANIDGAGDVPAATTASAPFGKVKHPLKSLSQAIDTENIPPRSQSKSGSGGVKKPEFRTTLKSLKQQKN